MYEIIYDGEEVYTVISVQDNEPLADFSTRHEAESFIQEKTMIDFVRSATPEQQRLLHRLILQEEEDRKRYIQEEIDAYGDLYDSPPQSTSSGEFAGGEFWISDDGEPRFG